MNDIDLIVGGIVVMNIKDGSDIVRTDMTSRTFSSLLTDFQSSTPLKPKRSSIVNHFNVEPTRGRMEDYSF